ncbi:uncharacterized protein J3R85_003991 [Psidium guajava]|nr:uncharacterized protein J3R85_003991 [Psidium guajava]
MSTQNPSSPLPLKGMKRRRDDEEMSAAAADDAETTASGSLKQSLTFNNTLVALRMIRAQFPRIDKVSIRPLFCG